MSDSERWLPAYGFEGLYEVSDLGRVRALLAWARHKPGRILKPSGSSGMHLRLVLRRADGTKARLCVHRLVLEAFIGPRPPGMEACHGPSGAKDNRLANLRWGTRRDNVEDMVRDGTRCKGEAVGTAKLTDAQATEILKRFAQDRPARRRRWYESVAEEYGVSWFTVRYVISGVGWKHLRSQAAA